MSPTDAASPVASPDALSAALPDLEMASAALGIALTEREIRHDLSQAFEGADFAAIDTGVVGLYRGLTQDTFAIIDVAHFRDVDTARAFLASASPSDSASSPDRQEIDLSGIGDEAFGLVRPDTEDTRLTTGIVYLRVGLIVSALVVRSDTPGVDIGMRELAQLVVDSIT